MEKVPTLARRLGFADGTDFGGWRETEHPADENAYVEFTDGVTSLNVYGDGDWEVYPADAVSDRDIAASGRTLRPLPGFFRRGVAAAK